MNKKFAYLYIALFLLICLAPSAGLLFGGPGESTENRTLAEAPQLRTEEGGFNVNVLSDAGAYFEDHFAFRNLWVTGYAMLTGKVFGVSGQDSVIVGQNDWLYYKDSLDDYLGTAPMTERQLFITAHTLAMIQEYAEENGIDFMFTVAPNKNTLYGENMPYYYQSYREPQLNLSRLTGYLEEEGVAYADLYEALSGRLYDGGSDVPAGKELTAALADQERILYHARDSHWNNRGAAIAADTILTAIDQSHWVYDERDYDVRTDYSGDLDAMLYPAAVSPEEELYFDPAPQFEYVTEVESNFDPKINTISSDGERSLVMYRDSFGNALLPFIAEAYETAYFSRSVPYYLTNDLDMNGADALIIERAERFLPEMAKNAPMMPAPEAAGDLPADASFSGEIEELTLTEQGLFTKITGMLPEEELDVRSRIYVRVNGETIYEAFPVSEDDGSESFQLLLDSELLSAEENSFEICIH